MHVAIATSERTRRGYMTAHSSACMPPIDPPITDSQRVIPRYSPNLDWARTMSRIVTTGKRDPYGRPSSGCGDDGPVDPWQPPSTLAHTTKYLSVSMGLPGPIVSSHHPGAVWPRPAGPAAWLSPVHAWQTSTALAASASRRPHVS